MSFKCQQSFYDTNHRRSFGTPAYYAIPVKHHASFLFCILLLLMHQVKFEMFLTQPFDPAHKKLVLIILSSNKGSGKSAHMPRLSRAFAVRIHSVWM